MKLFIILSICAAAVYGRMTPVVQILNGEAELLPAKALMPALPPAFLKPALPMEPVKPVMPMEPVKPILSMEPVKPIVPGDLIKPAEIPLLKKKVIPIVRYILNEDNMGDFALDMESADGTKIVEEGHLKTLPSRDETIEGSVTVTVMSGSYSYIGDDGLTYTVNWVADENGYRATGTHLPVPPPIPEEIKKSLAL